MAPNKKKKDEIPQPSTSINSKNSKENQRPNRVCAKKQKSQPKPKPLPKNDSSDSDSDFEPVPPKIQKTEPKKTELKKTEPKKSQPKKSQQKKSEPKKVLKHVDANANFESIVQGK